jgi:hypothetical protein
MFPNTHQAYRAGFENRDPDAKQYFESRTYAGQRHARQHARAWRESLRDHADTSYWGVQGIRVYRAFWLGVARGIRERDGHDPAAIS